MNVNDKILLDLIKDYTSTAAIWFPQLFHELAKSVPDENVNEFLKKPYCYKRHGWFSPSGKFGNGYIYRFHGKGCYLKVGKKAIDLDFGPEGEIDLFDAWRLFEFSKNSPKMYDDFTDYKEISELLIEAERNGKVEKVSNRSLYRMCVKS